MSYDIEVAARTVFGEARGESDEGRLAVAWVLVNRLGATGKWYSAKTLAGVCMKREQFSCWNSTDPNYSIISNLVDTDSALPACRYAVFEAVNKMGADPSNGATFYFNPAEAAPLWAHAYTLVATIGNHQFYKD